MRRPPRFSGVTLLAAAVLILLPALAWLQYSWLDQITDADRERRERTLRTAASQLAQEFESELAKAMSGLQLESTMAEQQNWASYAPRYQAWAESAIASSIVKTIYFVDGPETARPPTLRVWKPDTATFDVIDWPADLQPIRTRFDRAEPVERGPRGFDRLILPPAATGDEQLIAVPVLRITPADRSEPGRPPRPPDVRMLGFTIIRLNLLALGQEVLPELVRRHLFDDRGHTDYHVAIVERANPQRVIYQSEEGAAAAAAMQPDASTTLLGPRMGQMFIMARDRAQDARISTDRLVISVMEGRRDAHDVARAGAPGTVLGTGAFDVGPEGHWRLVAKHRAGSLEAAVGGVRTRNFLLSSGILALLGTAIGLIVVSARRADALAKQQLEFVAAVSHELRTPVSVIGAAAENLADGVVGEPGRVKKYGETIQIESRRLSETVERVLQLAGIASGRSSAARNVIPVSQLVNDSIKACQSEIERAGTTVEVSISEEFFRDPTQPDGVTKTFGDAAALRSALQNLISNAIKYGGDARWLRIAAEPTKRGVRITVEDRGLGIPAEDRRHLFEPFYRGRDAVSLQIQGSGLGLHLVRRIIDAHPHGTVTVESEPGKGSCFAIELPAVHEIIRRRDGVEVPHPKTT